MTGPLPRPSPSIVLDEAQLRCLTSPTRREVFLTLGTLGPSSIAEVAQALDRPADALYYHVRQLVRAGLVRSLGKRPATTRPEEVFEADRAYLGVDPTNPAPGYLAARRKMVSSVVREFGTRASEAVEATDGRDTSSLPVVLRSTVVRLEDDALAELDRRLAELDDFVRSHTLTDGGHLVSILAGRVRRPARDEAQGRPTPT